MLIYTIGKQSIKFDEDAFFYFILPPIIFAAGYTLKRRNFVKNIAYIALLGFIGTIISMVVLSMFVIMFNEMIYGDDLDNKLLQTECLMLSAVLCATDTVAALAIVRESEFPTLNSILFGEGVVNDAIAILIYKAIESMIESKSDDPDFAYTDDLNLIEASTIFHTIG